jgi:hypothetical protein
MDDIREKDVKIDAPPTRWLNVMEDYGNRTVLTIWLFTVIIKLSKQSIAYF